MLIKSQFSYIPDDTIKSIKYMLKVPPESPQATAIINMLNSFKREILSYYELLPEFEKMYSNSGYPIRIAPKAYKFDKDLGFDVILMEDVRVDGYKTMNRLDGLDMQHTKCAVQKLAQFHAASAAYIAKEGQLPELLMKPMLSEKLIEIVAQAQKPQEQKLIDSLSLYNAEHLKEKIVSFFFLFISRIM